MEYKLLRGKIIEIITCDDYTVILEKEDNGMNIIVRYTPRNTNVSSRIEEQLNTNIPLSVYVELVKRELPSLVRNAPVGSDYINLRMIALFILMYDK